MVRYLFGWIAWALSRARKGAGAPDFVSFRLHGAYRDHPMPVHPLIRRLRPPRITLLELAERMRAVARDEHVTGVVLELGDLQLADAQVETLRSLIEELRAAGKRVVAWSHGYDRSTYYLASAADEVLLLPGGGLAPLGVASGVPFVAEALARIGIEVDVLAVTPYKTAADALTRREMSDEAREMTNWLLDGAFANHLDAMAAGRGIERDRAHEVVDQTPCTDLQAVELGLVDGIVTREALPTRLGQPGRSGEPARIEHWQRRSPVRPKPVRPSRRVGLISIEGVIVHGESARPPFPSPAPLVAQERTGDLTVLEAARRAREDRTVAAVVVYVNSPGGSPTASEAIRSALAELATHKPVVVSMGPVAASGGYYVATAARPVFAQPGTLTGSIGVVAGKPVVRGLLERLGVNMELVQRGRHALIAAPVERFSDEERSVIGRTIERTYDLFLQRVSEGRGIGREDLEHVAGGRVWTGRQAHERGLVDELGGLEQAIARARSLAGLPQQAGVHVLQPSVSPFPAAGGAGVSLVPPVVQLLAEGRPVLISPLLLDGRLGR